MAEGFEPDDVGGEFAEPVLDEAFVRAALVHEPSARERMLMARPARSAPHLGEVRAEEDDDGTPLELRPLDDSAHWQWSHPAPSGRWQRVVARLMLVVIGVVAVLVAAAALYRAAGGDGQRQPAPSTPSSSTSPQATAAATPPPVLVAHGSG
ncbi:hypothetical protein ACFQZC_26360 [Streptacidiphilus monticola]